VKARVVGLIVGLVVYGFLWIIALGGAPGLIPLLVIPFILALLVAGGNWLSAFMGLKGRPQQFQEKPESDE